MNAFLTTVIAVVIGPLTFNVATTQKIDEYFEYSI